jgi:asparagine synthase (glutamine-hydrolysing)
MCGISGYRVIESSAGAWADELPAAVRALRHRGPDDEGFWYDAERLVGLGHRRLSIIDLSVHGHQPMTSACGQWHMVFNGEIYNFKQIRAELEPLGYRFAGTGDSEAILAAFAQWGPEAVTRFIGMFAIALWHQPTRRLHLLRDRVGVKPLYYRWDGKVLSFGSELKALREFKGWAPEIDRDGLSDYLRYGYINDPRTIYRQVFKLPPAHHLVLHESGQVELHRYWNVLEHMGRRHSRGEEELADELEALMVDAFKYRMIADVPVGVFLSGGIDSSVVSAILQKHGGQQIKTFTIGFDVLQYDESPHAAAVAKHLGTDHYCRILKVDDAKNILPRWGDLYDEPFADDSGIPTLLVSQVAAERVKVVLSADGGDELFGGYSSYTSVLSQWERIRRVPQTVRSVSAAAVNASGIPQLNAYLTARSAAGNTGVGRRVVTKLANVGSLIGARGVGELFLKGHAHFASLELATLIGHDVMTRELADVYPGEPGEKLCLWDLHHYMPADILTKVDRATMAVSIEGREPLLDHRLIEFAFSLPFGMRRGPLGPKHILRKVLYRHVPRALIDRPKQGFAMPVKEWLATDLRHFADETLDDSFIARQGLFDRAMVRRYLDRLHRGDPSVRKRIWDLLAFQMWFRRWMPS